MFTKQKVVQSQLVALLDIDKTILLGPVDYSDDMQSCRIPNGSINFLLLNALKNANIKTLYLFTDMTFDTSSLIERKALVEYLKNVGFTIKGVITPIDCGWSLSRENLEKFSSFIVENKLLNRREIKPNAVEAIRDSADYKILTALFRRDLNTPSSDKLGQAFRESTQDISLSVSIDGRVKAQRDALIRSHLAKSFADARSLERGLSHVKGVMFDYFLSHRPMEFSKCLVIDDLAVALSSVQEVNDQANILKMDLQIFLINSNTNYESLPDLISESPRRRCKVM